MSNTPSPCAPPPHDAFSGPSFTTTDRSSRTVSPLLAAHDFPKFFLLSLPNNRPHTAAADDTFWCCDHHFEFPSQLVKGSCPRQPRSQKSSLLPTRYRSSTGLTPYGIACAPGVLFVRLLKVGTASTRVPRNHSLCLSATFADPTQSLIVVRFYSSPAPHLLKRHQDFRCSGRHTAADSIALLLGSGAQQVHLLLCHVS